MDEYPMFQKWQTYNREVTSPQVFIDFSYYYLIAAALGRKVWTGPNHRQLFPNIYPILVGEPGIGKGLIIKSVERFLRKHKLRPADYKNVDPSKDMQVGQEAIMAANFATANINGDNKHKPADEHLLIPVAADCTTFEALVHACAKNTRACLYKYYDPAIEKEREGIYRHASMCFCLEEMSSLAHKEAHKIINMLIKAFDCGRYEYVTKNSGEDCINAICMNFFAGTTPAFIESCFTDKLMTEGFSSRAWMLYAPKNRKYSTLHPELDEIQLQAEKDIDAHIAKLYTLFGSIQFTQEATDFIEKFWIESNESPTYKRPNTSEKLNAYYSRKDIHLKKLAILMYLGEIADCDDSMRPKGEVGLRWVLRAKAFLEAAEPLMHLALNFNGENPWDKVAKKIVKWLKQNGPHPTERIVMEFFADVKPAECNEILEHLNKSGKIALNELTQWVIK